MSEEIKRNIVEAWISASKDLGIKIQPRFSVYSENNEAISCLLLVEDFGSKLGTAVFAELHESPHPLFSAKGYYVSTLGDLYTAFNRSLFVETLNDWGYFGDPGNKPEWCKSKSR